MVGNGPPGAQRFPLWSHSPWRDRFQFRAFHVEMQGAQPCRCAALRQAHTLISKSYEWEKAFIKLPQRNGSLLLGLNATGRENCF